MLLSPSNILFKFKCYTSIKIERIDQIDDISLFNQSNQQLKHPRLSSPSGRYSLRISSFYPKIHIKLRTFSNPVPTTDSCRISKNSMVRNCDPEVSNIIHL
jgi:hypothetical protein